jgi:hypothetical protein
MKKSVSIEKIGFVIGLINAAALIAYFFAMKALNLAQIIELRFFNILIVAVGIIIGINYLKSRLHEQEFYLKGLAQGMIITVVTVVAFAAFMTVYLTYIDMPLMEEISKRVPYTGTLNGMVIFIAIFMEGMASGAIITFSAMQYLKSQGTVKTGYE